MAQAVWSGLKVDSRFALFHIHHMNRVNSDCDSVMMTTL